MSKQYKDIIVDYCKDHEGVSFAELNREFEKAGLEYKGDYVVQSNKLENIVYWQGWNKEAATAIQELLKDDVVRLEPCQVFIYMIDGEFPDLPVVKREPSYKTPHWLPCVLNLA